MKRHISSVFIPAISLTLMLVTGCVTTQEERHPEQQTAIESSPVLPVEEQEQLAMDTFNEMLDMTIGRPRQEVLPELEAGYEKIIKEAPDTYLAEESHYRLMIQYFEDPRQQQIDKAEEIYRLYFERYKEPKLKLAMNSTLARLYYNYKVWDRLDNFMIPFIKQYVETGKIEDTLYFFYYSEAKYWLKDYDEAARGFRLMIRENPPEVELKHAHKRLMEIRDLKEQTIKKEQ